MFDEEQGNRLKQHYTIEQHAVNDILDAEIQAGYILERGSRMESLFLE